MKYIGVWERCVRVDKARRPERITGSALWWYGTRCYRYTQRILPHVTHYSSVYRATTMMNGARTHF
jgi:hypothetical protein